MNYKGRAVRIYEGFIGLPEDGFRHVFNGVIDTIKRTDSGISIEVVDLLKAIDDIEVPPKLDIKLLNDITAADTTIGLYQPFSNQASGLDVSMGYIRIGDEIIAYTTFNSATNQLINCTRGYYGSTAAEAKANDKVQKCRYYNGNPFDLLLEMLETDAEYTESDLDLAAFAYWRDFPATDINYEAMISEPTKLGGLAFEILEMIDCRMWEGENLKITIRRNVPNEPGLEYINLTDEANITNAAVNVDMLPSLNDEARYTRVTVYWNPSAIGKSDESATYGRIDISEDSDAESPNDANAIIEKKIYCRWITTKYMQEEIAMDYVRNQSARILFRNNTIQPLVDFEVEIKDLDIKTGSFALIATDAVLDQYGNVIDQLFQIVKRDPVGPQSIRYSAMKFSQKRIAFIAPDGLPDYAAATEDQRQYWYFCDDNGFIGDKEASYHFY
jgi:hypothetical protein